ncbi:MAG TPA: hypothetical protein PLO78_09730 [Candidatus Omnitrophota bacterium]|nr:hypothetical protein [Candidatus Omnitrophota bacterium]
MRNQAIPFLKKASSVVPEAGNAIFYGIILLIILTTQIPATADQALVLKKFLFSKDEKIFRFFDPGAPFSVFDPFLPPKENIYFLMDTPYSPENATTEQLQAAQRYFTPRFIVPFPTEKKAIIFCSTDTLAEKRAHETGYKLIHSLGNGKGIGEKLP